MKILLAGASGTIGTALIPLLLQKGHHVQPLQRHDPEQPYYWNPAQNLIQGSIEGFDVIFNLSGFSLMDGRWNRARKIRIRQSRIAATKTLVNAMRTLKEPPKVFISASAIGFYGNMGDQVATEDTPAGSGFLASLSQEWEEEALKATSFGVRVVFARFGMVLAKERGALGKMAPFFRMGLGAYFGSGRQWMSWIHIEDLAMALKFCMRDDSIQGPVNFVSPEPVTNKEFSDILAQVFDTTCRFSLPEWLLKLAVGEEFANEVLLSSLRVAPQKLQNAGFTFRFSALKNALENLLT